MLYFTKRALIAFNNLKSCIFILIFRFDIQENGDYRSISVAQYFEEQFDKKEFVKKLQYPQLPCLRLNKKAWIPLEVYG